MISLGVLFGLLSMLAYGISPVIVRKALRTTDVSSLSFYLHLFIVIIVGLFILPLQHSFAITSSAFWSLLAAGAVGGLAAFSNYKAFSLQKAPLVSSITSIYPIFSIILAIFFFKELPGVLSICAVIITLFGISILSYHKEKGKLLTGSGYAFLTAFCWGLYVFFMRFSLQYASTLTVTFYSELFVFAFVSIPYFLKIKRITAKQYVPLIGAAFFTALGTYAMNLGLMNGFVYIVAPVSAASPLVTAYLSHTLLKEKLARYQYAAMFLTVIGIIILSV